MYAPGICNLAKITKGVRGSTTGEAEVDEADFVGLKQG